MNSKEKIYTTANRTSFNFCRGIENNYTIQKAETIYPKMDGKAAIG